MSNAKNTIDYICSLWGEDRLDIPRKLEWVDNESFSTRAGLERQSKYLKPSGSLYALVENEKNSSQQCCNGRCWEEGTQSRSPEFCDRIKELDKQAIGEYGVNG